MFRGFIDRLPNICFRFILYFCCPIQNEGLGKLLKSFAAFENTFIVYVFFYQSMPTITFNREGGSKTIHLQTVLDVKQATNKL